MRTPRLLSATGAVRTSRSSRQPTAHLLSVGVNHRGRPRTIPELRVLFGCGTRMFHTARFALTVPFVRSAERVPLTMSRAQSGAGLGGPRPRSFSRGPGTLVI